MVWRTSDLLTNPKCLFPPQTSLSNVRLRDATGYATSPSECSGSHLKVSMSETKCPIIHPAIPPFPSSPTAHHLSQWQLCPSRVYPKTLGIPQGILVALPSEYIQDKTTFSKSASPGWLKQPQNVHVSLSSSLRLQSDHGNLYLSHPQLCLLLRGLAQVLKKPTWPCIFWLFFFLSRLISCYSAHCLSHTGLVLVDQTCEV